MIEEIDNDIKLPELDNEDIENIEEIGNLEDIPLDTNDTNDTKEIPNQCNDLNNFIKVIKEFVNDLSRTFGDYKEIIELQNRLKNNDSNENNENNIIYNFCKEVYPKHFFDILYENDSLFEKEEFLELLPNIDFKKLWNDDITSNTKSTIWKYLQLVLFSIITDVKSDESFGDTAKLFEAINESEFKEKIEETIKDIDNIFKSNDTNDVSENALPNLPNAEKLHDHINSMMEGKIGSLAKEIAEETAKDLNIDMENAESVNDVFKQLFKNPAKLMGLVKNVGSKLDTKIKSGEIKESELLEEASDLVNKLKDMPGVNNLESMFSKMGVPGMGKGAKVDLNAFNKQMEQNMKMAKMRERMKNRLEKNGQQINNELLPDNNDIEKRNEMIRSLGLNVDGLEELIYSTGDKVEKSDRPLTNRKKKKPNKKKK